MERGESFGHRMVRLFEDEIEFAVTEFDAELAAGEADAFREQWRIFAAIHGPVQINQAAAALLVFVQEHGGARIEAGVHGEENGYIRGGELLRFRKFPGGGDGDVFRERQERGPALLPEWIVVLAGAVILGPGT